MVTLGREPPLSDAELRGQEMFRGLSTPEYLAWQQALLEKLYSGLEIASVFGRRYPTAILRPAAEQSYPFPGLCSLEERSLQELVLDPEQELYLEMLGRSLRWPQMKGFALKEIVVSRDGLERMLRVVARVSNFEQNVATSHILEWELYRLYESHRIASGSDPRDDLLRKLPRWQRYHGERSEGAGVLKPNDAFPLLSVQAMVVFRDTSQHEPTWRVVLAKRSAHVVLKPGLFQFQPAGGFEVHDAEGDAADAAIEANFDPLVALLREYAEELFDVTEQPPSDTRDALSVLRHPSVVWLLGAIADGRAFIEYLGVAIDLPVLRHELSFLIVVEDPSFVAQNPIRGSWETRQVSCPTLQELAPTIAGGTLHGSSAALLQLALDNARFRELGLHELLPSDKV